MPRGWTVKQNYNFNRNWNYSQKNYRIRNYFQNIYRVTFAEAAEERSANGDIPRWDAFGRSRDLSDNGTIENSYA